MKENFLKRVFWLIALLITAVLFSASAGGAFAATPGELKAALPGGWEAISSEAMSKYVAKMSAELQRMSPQNFNLSLPGLQGWWGKSCTNCSKPFKESSRFCTECGKPVADICPKCDITVELGSKFCSNCGISLQKTCSCGARLNSEAAFCEICGKKVEK